MKSGHSSSDQSTTNRRRWQGRNAAVTLEIGIEIGAPDGRANGISVHAKMDFAGLGVDGEAAWFVRFGFWQVWQE